MFFSFCRMSVALWDWLSSLNFHNFDELLVQDLNNWIFCIYYLNLYLFSIGIYLFELFLSHLSGTILDLLKVAYSKGIRYCK